MDSQIESTATLLGKVKDGDDEARNRLCAIYLPMLQRWAHGRLPEYARDLAETDDMVQASLIKALNKLDDFQSQHEGAFLAYLRTTLLNQIRDEIRRYSRQDAHNTPIQESKTSNQGNALEQAVGAEVLERYERSLTLLGDGARQAVVLRVEFGFSYPEIAAAMDFASANAARMAVSRALHRLAELM
ncbi:MAG: RNA polymerase sigma factor [Proteobacteria bacterium]|nr:MAG: RNA polymerase sigma factor [Pseudomonadota bacterium]